MGKELFQLQSSTIIGMVHCLPLPTTAGFSGDYQKIIAQAVQDAVTLEKAGVDAVIVENMGDTLLRAPEQSPVGCTDSSSGSRAQCRGASGGD